jgi:hypothetical protein
MIDPDNLDRARKVYVAEDGTSRLSADLQFEGTEKTRRAAGYTVWSAMGISVAESFLYGCKPIIVEGASDQHYLTAIKLYLIRNGKLQPVREMVFPPAGGAKGVKAVASMVMAKNDMLPIAFFDADSAGLQTIKQLKETLYAHAEDRLLSVSNFLDLQNSEIEDLFPTDLIVTSVDSVFKTAERPFVDSAKQGGLIVPQIELWATNNGVKPELGWKVDVAKRVKHRLLDGATVPEDFAKRWQKMFESFAA